MDKYFVRNMCEALAAILFALAIISQLSPGAAMTKEQILKEESQIEKLKRQIEQIRNGLPYADGRQYSIDQARIRELQREIDALESAGNGDKD